MVSLEDKDVLEVGGSLLYEFVFDYLNVKSWSAIETPNYEVYLKDVGGIYYTGTVVTNINYQDYSNFSFQNSKNKKTKKYNLFLDDIEDLPLAHNRHHLPKIIDR